MKKGVGKRAKPDFKHVAARPPAETRRIAMGLRVSPALRQELEKAAAKKGRSLSQEIEHRLEASFEATDIVNATLAFAYGEETARTVDTIADTLRTMQSVHGMKARGEIPNSSAELMLNACVEGLHGLIAKYRKGAEQ